MRQRLLLLTLVVQYVTGTIALAANGVLYWNAKVAGSYGSPGMNVGEATPTNTI